MLDLVPLEGHLFPVGRLDLRSEGLILLTDDGKLAHRLTHPRYEHEKEYRALVEGEPDEAVLNKWRQGVFLDGRRTAPAEVTVVGREKGKTWLHVTWLKVILREGRKRQIRRTAAMLGHPVHRLIRVRIGSLHLGDLKPGHWRTLTESEVEALRATVAQPPPKARRTPRKRRAPGTRGKAGRKRRKGGGGKRKY